MRAKVNELEGAQLNAAVALAQGARLMSKGLESEHWQWPSGTRLNIGAFSPSVNWSQAGPLIENEKISIEFIDPHWSATIDQWREGWMTDHLHEIGVGSGESPLIAAMRAYVNSKLGREVEVP